MVSTSFTPLNLIMANLPISLLPQATELQNNNQFVVVQSGTTNQFSFSNMNILDFDNIVNLGTGVTASSITIDGNSGNTFVYTYDATGTTTISTTTTNIVNGRMYSLVLQTNKLSTVIVNNIAGAPNFNLARIQTSSPTPKGTNIFFYIGFNNLLIPFANYSSPTYQFTNLIY